MNTPAPNRRRRQAAKEQPQSVSARQNPLAGLEDFPSPSEGAPRMRRSQGRMPEIPLQDAPQTPVRRRAACENRAASARSRTQDRRNARQGSFELSLPVRIVLIALCLLVFVTCAVSVTRNYLSMQEERRRLEAEAAERAQHPLHYGDLITQYAAAQGLDPALVSAIILCESSYNPQAESYLGARGLMQLMPDTAEWIAHKLKEDDASYTFDRLYDPETNIRFGTWYLGYLSRRFGGDATKIVCAYHAGQGNVDAWLKKPEYSRDGVTLDVIPTDDTAAYAARVLRAMEVYRKYHFPAGQQPPAA